VPRVDTASLISISRANELGISRLVRDAELGNEPVLLRNNKPVAAVVSMERLAELEQREDDVRDVALVAARMLADGGERFSLDAVLEHFGFTREQLREDPQYREE